MPAAVQAGADAPENGILDCTYDAPAEVQGYTAHLCDGDPDTKVTLYRNETLTVQLPQGQRAGALYLDFYELPDPVEIAFFDADGNQLDRIWPFEPKALQALIPIESEHTASVSVKASARTLALCECYACTDAFVPPFFDTEAHADVLVFLNKPGDELTLLGGLLAQLAGEHGLTVQVVYLTKVDGYHMHQCMEILSRMGVTRQPLFGSARETDSRHAGGVYNAIGARTALLQRYVNLIRSHTPQVIVAPDADPEQENFTDSILSDIVCTAAAYAADETKYPEITPLTDVSKVYTLKKDGATEIRMDGPLNVFDGVTAAALADGLLALYREERMFLRKIPETVRFTLCRSTVGEDAEKNDLLEHLSTDRFAHYQDPTPIPTDTPEPTATPTSEPTPTAAATEQPEEGLTETASPAEDAPRAGLFSCAGKEETPVPSEQPTEPSTSAPTATPTAEPTPEPTEEPTPEPTPDPNAEYFLSEDGEAFELDFDNGHWWYKNRVLSVDIQRVKTNYDGKKPLVYYLADIRMRDFTSYRSGVHTLYTQPWVYTRKEKAVLAITGDNLDGAETQFKGCLMRKGVLYSNAGREDTLLIKEDMTMEILHQGEFSPRVLMDHGVRDTYSFGPTLVENGVINDQIERHRVTHPNPRCGIGMIEPGHWVAIVTDGRQPGYSYSITLQHFAQMFYDLGCTVAYNLDGGSSAGMCIMGEMVNKHEAPNTVDCQRPWMDSLMWGYSEQVPSPDVWTVHDGYHH